ncbi:MAG TPA: hypothetical protein VNQ78_13970 [Paracoccus sp. (in: a-proteobacteria)]|uniref:hypothetical protein n=1 Tax=Paracoccus sp. TaxID=267 RepID=UPI002B6EC507|nr:hypothetical protein [Paracoccus sp. (in: a-proteobacteria)]HWL57765.1 hypothetical protein [Paracoccus sp. (in: a-proteobacteria)]
MANSDPKATIIFIRCGAKSASICGGWHRHSATPSVGGVSRYRAFAMLDPRLDDPVTVQNPCAWRRVGRQTSEWSSDMFVKGMLTATVLTAGIGSYALAQTSSEIVTGGGQTVVVPEAATESKGVSPIGTQVVSEYPAFNQTMNNETIASTLVAQGFENIHILREGSLMTITGTRGNDDINLVYNLVEGRLIKVNGERILSAEEQSSGSSGDAASSPPSAAPGGVSDDPADDADGDDATDDADGGSDDATDDGGMGDTGTDDGAGSDAGDTSDDGAGGSDTGSGDAGGGSDTGGGSESDGGADSDSSSG